MEPDLNRPIFLLRIKQIEINPHMLKIQEIFPERVAIQVHKRVRMHEFVYKISKSRGKYFLYFSQKVD